MSLLVCGGIFVEEIADRHPRLGGSGLTAALAAARYGADVTLAGWVGAGEADETFALLDAAGVDRLGVEVLDGTTTTYCIADPADLAMPNPAIRQGVVPRGGAPALPSSPVVLCFGTPGFDVVRARWLDRATDGATFVFDRQGAQSMILGGRMAATVPAARRVMVANVLEARTETKAGSVARAISGLPPAGFETAVVKAGPWGVLIVGRDGTEQPFGAHDVVVRSTIGSGDVFGGVLAALLSRGDALANATRTATAAAAAWIEADAQHPPIDLAARAEVVAAKPAVWVDRRMLEPMRFEASFPAGTEAPTRERIGRALRYLGMETMHTEREPTRGLDLTRVVSDDVGAAVRAAIASVRAEVGVATSAGG